MPRVSQILVPMVALLAGIVIAGVLYRVGATNAVGAFLMVGFITIVASYCDLILDRLSERDRINNAFDDMVSTQQPPARRSRRRPPRHRRTQAATSTTRSPPATTAW